METLSPHDEKELKKSSKQEEREQQSREILRKKERKSTALKLLLFAVIILVVFYFFRAYSTREPPFTTHTIHWHAGIEVSLCGKPFTELLSRGRESHAGIMLLHTHGDGVIHIEGQPLKKEEIALGKFMDVLGYTFSESELIDKKNGDLCNNMAGKVRMFVNGAENFEFRNYVIKGTSDASEQRIQLRFE
ncbi:hypothetical protein HY486_01150 [Candidatus Woesearchaeota archaeon]|nr:hypothetical protein [Candidatus Woesearchaeota archaeon]